jgi:hypothetical protein
VEDVTDIVSCQMARFSLPGTFVHASLCHDMIGHIFGQSPHHAAAGTSVTPSEADSQGRWGPLTACRYSRKGPTWSSVSAANHTTTRIYLVRTSRIASTSLDQRCSRLYYCSKPLPERRKCRTRRCASPLRKWYSPLEYPTNARSAISPTGTSAWSVPY